MRNILISGATSGIGAATASAFAQAAELNKHPLHLLLTGRRREQLEVLSKQLTTDSVSVEIGCFDIRSRAAVASFVESLGETAGKIDILVNNAGLAAGRDAFQDADIDDWEQMIDTNIKGLLYLTRALVPGMVQRRMGHIINIGSVAGRYTYPNGSVYCGTKFAVTAISEGLRMDLLGKGVRVSNIEPGMVDTEFSLVRFKGDSQAAAAVYKGLEPLHAEDIARTILWVTQQPAHVNVQELLIMPTAQASIRDVHRS